MKNTRFKAVVFIMSLAIIVLAGQTSAVAAERRSAKPLSAADMKTIGLAKKRIIETNGHDYSLLYRLLESKRGQKEQIFAISKEVGDPIFCLKKASQLNPDLRDDITKELVIQLKTKYKDKMSEEKLDAFIKGHEADCRRGIPQFIY